MVERFHKKIVYLEIVLSTDYIFVCIHIHAQTPVCIFKYIHILEAFCLLKYVRMHCASVVSDFIFLGSKITADGDCSHEIKRRLLLGGKVMTNLDSILKSRHYFANKGSSSRGYGFSCGHV